MLRTWNIWYIEFPIIYMRFISLLQFLNLVELISFLKYIINLIWLSLLKHYLQFELKNEKNNISLVDSILYQNQSKN